MNHPMSASTISFQPTLPAADAAGSFLRFRHRAMATIFEILIADEDPVLARQAAHAAFTEVDRLELELSRFIDNSDISRVNAMAPGESIILGPDAFICLQVCRQLFDDTGGAFDITVGALVTCWRYRADPTGTPGTAELEQAKQRMGLARLQLDHETFRVTLAGSTSIALDLGGYGKGYTLEQVRKLLDEWGIDRFLVHAGHSSVLARGHLESHLGWPVSLSHPTGAHRVIETLPLQNSAMASSGVAKSGHVIDPRSGQPVTGEIAVWVCGPDAGICDGLSTAFLVMDSNECSRCLQKYPEYGMLWVRENKVGRINWQKC